MNHSNTCKRWKESIAQGTISKIRGVGWVRVVRVPDDAHQDFEKKRYMEIQKCPFCGTAVAGEVK